MVYQHKIVAWISVGGNQNLLELQTLMKQHLFSFQYQVFLFNFYQNNLDFLGTAMCSVKISHRHRPPTPTRFFSG